MAERNYRVTQLPPTIGVKDPEVRSFLDALANAWDHRSGTTDSTSPDRFITASEFKGLATNALLEALSSSVPGGTPSSGGGPGSVGEVIHSISDEIKRSLLYQLLGTEYPDINVGALQARIDSAFGQANTLFMQERTTRENQFEAVTEQFTAQASRLSSAEAAISSETSTRVNKDNALAAAINNIWAKIGGSTAVIQDGALAAVTPTTSQATKWTQVQAAVTDPNTGQVSSTSIKQELNSYASANNDTLNSTYSVRAQVVAGGRTIVGGFGLMASSGAGSIQGPTIDFGVRADRFWVGGTDGSGDIPFIVTGGKTYIKTALIQDLTVDAIKIKNQALTDLWSTTVEANPANLFTSTMKTFMSVSFFVPNTGSGTANLMITMTANAIGNVGSAGGPQCWIYVDGVPIDYVGISLFDGYSGVIPMTTSCTVSANANHVVEFRAINVSPWNGYMGRGGLNVLVAKK